MYWTSDEVLKIEIKIHNYGDYNEDCFFHFIKDITSSGIIKKQWENLQVLVCRGTDHRTIY